MTLLDLEAFETLETFFGTNLGNFGAVLNQKNCRKIPRSISAILVSMGEKRPI